MTVARADTAALGPSRLSQNDDGLACWLEAVRRRREQLDLDVHAGERSQLILDRLVTVRRRISGVAEDLYDRAWAALERASSDLAEFDLQSQGALDASKQRVREASRRLFKHGRPAGAGTPGEPDREVRQLEQEHTDAHAADTRLLRERIGRRIPLERRYSDTARELLLAGQSLIGSLEADRPRLLAAVETAASARAELRELDLIEHRGSSKPDDGRVAPELSGMLTPIEAQGIYEAIRGFASRQGIEIERLEVPF